VNGRATSTLVATTSTIKDGHAIEETRTPRQSALWAGWAAVVLEIVFASGCGDNKPAAPRVLPVGGDGEDSSDAATDASDGPALPTAGASASRMFVPAYVYPGAEWDRLIAAVPTVGIIVANPADGPGAIVDSTYLDAMARARQAGIMVLGYVTTAYGQRASADVLLDINAYYDLYRPSGIFLSEGPMDTDCDAMESTFLAYANAARARDSQAFIALGTRLCASYVYFTDLMVLFSAQLGIYDAFQPAAWMPARSPERFAHLVSEVPGEAMEATLGRAHALGAGWIYVTDDVLPNPWDTLPSYFDREVQIISTLR
jgi:hypothetical protein